MSRFVTHQTSISVLIRHNAHVHPLTASRGPPFDLLLVINYLAGL